MNEPELIEPTVDVLDDVRPRTPELPPAIDEIDELEIEFVGMPLLISKI